MGEYFCVYLKKEENTVRYYPKTEKLMEFCWHKTTFSMLLNAVLYKNPMRMAVVGDDITTCAMREVERVFGKDPQDHYCNRKDTERKFLYGRKIVNHTKKEYVDYDKYAERSINRLQLVVNPLIFLTLYSGCYIQGKMPQTGAWNCDLVSVEDEAPEGYAEKDYTFQLEINGLIDPKSGLIEGPVGDNNLLEIFKSDYAFVDDLATDMGWYIGSCRHMVTFDYLKSPIASTIELPEKDLILNMIELASSPTDDSPVREPFIELVTKLVEENEKAAKIAEYYDLPVLETPAGGK